MNINKIRSNSLISIYQAESGHTGGVLSSIDLIAYLFMKEMNYDKKDFSNKAIVSCNFFYTNRIFLMIEYIYIYYS